MMMMMLSCVRLAAGLKILRHCWQPGEPAGANDVKHNTTIVADCRCAGSAYDGVRPVEVRTS